MRDLFVENPPIEEIIARLYRQSGEWHRRMMTPTSPSSSARFRMLLQYRAAALAGFGTQFFWGLDARDDLRGVLPLRRLRRSR